jgi:hypothetical protein
MSEHQQDQPMGDDRSILQLKNVSREDSGIYTCLAINGAGYPASDTMLLVVQCEYIFQTLFSFFYVFCAANSDSYINCGLLSPFAFLIEIG